MASTDIEQSAKQPPASEVVTSDPKLISSQYDVANKILAETAAYENEIFTEEEDRKLRWKIDWHLIPAVRLQSLCVRCLEANFLQLALCATLNGVDKVSVSTAAIYGLQEDLNLQGTEFSWIGR